MIEDLYVQGMLYLEAATDLEKGPSDVGKARVGMVKDEIDSAIRGLEYLAEGKEFPTLAEDLTTLNRILLFHPGIREMPSPIGYMKWHKKALDTYLGLKDGDEKVFDYAMVQDFLETLGRGHVSSCGTNCHCGYR